MSEEIEKAFEEWFKTDGNIKCREHYSDWDKTIMRAAYLAAQKKHEQEMEKLKSFWKPVIVKFESKFPNAGNANTTALTALTEAFDIHCKNERLEQEMAEMRKRNAQMLYDGLNGLKMLEDWYRSGGA